MNQEMPSYHKMSFEKKFAWNYKIWIDLFSSVIPSVTSALIVEILGKQDLSSGFGKFFLHIFDACLINFYLIFCSMFFLIYFSYFLFVTFWWTVSVISSNLPCKEGIANGSFKALVDYWQPKPKWRLKGVFAKNERGFRLKLKLIRSLSLPILLLLIRKNL